MSKPKKTVKPFHYNLMAADFLAAVIQVPEEDRGRWVLTLALDLVNAVGSTDYARSLIAEVEAFRQAQSDNGLKGAEIRYGRNR